MAMTKLEEELGIRFGSVFITVQPVRWCYRCLPNGRMQYREGAVSIPVGSLVQFYGQSDYNTDPNKIVVVWNGELYLINKNVVPATRPRC